MDVKTITNPGQMEVVQVIGNGLKVELLPEKGGDIYKIYIHDNNILWESPWGIGKLGHRADYCHTSKERWLQNYPGGWQILFPNAGDDSFCYGVMHNFHGEACQVPWQYQVEHVSESLVEIRFSTRLYKTPYALERVVVIDEADQSIGIQERITNHGQQDLWVEWGQHIAFGAPLIGPGVTLEVPAGTIDSAERDPVRSRLKKGTYSWPIADASSDLSIVPAGKATDFAILKDLSAGWYAIHNEELDLRVTVEWDTEIMPNLWLWQEFNGLQDYPFYGECYVMGVEPCSASHEGGLHESIQRGEAIVMKAQQTRTFELKLSWTRFKN
ncbi:DUF4432 family protein [Paenibacillus sp. GCM10027629]|uniref:DUF4432 family protein n=1 Tax=Paenibacillus sp. GCM10027629 TaxID=3273414 RepID=UPI0036429401